MKNTRFSLEIAPATTAEELPQANHPASPHSSPAPASPASDDAIPSHSGEEKAPARAFSQSFSIREKASIACCEWMVKCGIEESLVKELLGYFVHTLPQQEAPGPFGTKQSLAALALSSQYFHFDALCSISPVLGIHPMPFIREAPSSSALAEQHPELIRLIESLDIVLLSGNARSYITLGHVDPFLLSVISKEPAFLSRLPRADVPLSLVLLEPSHFEKIIQGP
jgi:hypothetical protein